MKKLIDRGMNTTLFKMKWAFMSRRKRYAYLWLRTKEAELKRHRQLNQSGLQAYRAKNVAGFAGGNQGGVIGLAAKPATYLNRGQADNLIYLK